MNDLEEWLALEYPGIFKKWREHEQQKLMQQALTSNLGKKRK